MQLAFRFLLPLLIISNVCLAKSIRLRGSISGIVLDPAGKPIPHARVRALRLQPRRSTSPPVYSSVTGTFSIPALDSGNYSICASVSPTKGLIGDCFWLDAGLSQAANPKLITLASAQKLTGLTLRMQQGRRLQVKIQDTANILSSKDAKGGSRTVNVELLGPSGAMPRSLLATRPERDGPVYEAVVPAGNLIRLRVGGNGVNVADDQGRSLANGRADQQFQPSASANVPTKLVFRVSPKN